MTNHTLTLPQTQEPNQVDLTIKTITFNLHIYNSLLLRSSPPSQNNTWTLIQLLFRLSIDYRRRVNKIE